MNSALHRMTDEDREAHMADIYRIFGADLDADEQAHIEEMRTGIDWVCLGVWVTLIGIGVAFWAFVAWGIMTFGGVM
jgi:hypothetical protein